MKFFHYSQNNSGGGFDTDAKTGLGVHMVIEARNADDANTRAEGLGMYFNGCDDGRDCECCGDRWYPKGSGDGDDKPMIYGDDVSDGTRRMQSLGMSWGDSFIHFADGTFKKVVDVKAEAEQDKDQMRDEYDFSNAKRGAVAPKGTKRRKKSK